MDRIFQECVATALNDESGNAAMDKGFLVVAIPYVVKEVGHGLRGAVVKQFNVYVAKRRLKNNARFSIYGINPNDCQDQRGD